MEASNELLPSTTTIFFFFFVDFCFLFFIHIHHKKSRIHCGASPRQAYRLEGKSDPSVPPRSLTTTKKSRIHCGASLRQAYRLEGKSDPSVPPRSLTEYKCPAIPSVKVPRAKAGGADHGSAPPATDWHLCAVLEISISASERRETKISPGCYSTCHAVLPTSQSLRAIVFERLIRVIRGKFALLCLSSFID